VVYLARMLIPTLMRFVYCIADFVVDSKEPEAGNRQTYFVLLLNDETHSFEQGAC
jgi:hypothetical protein